MTNINPSPLLNDFLARRASAPQQTEISQTPEKPEENKKINKALIGAAAATGLAAIAFAGISMLRKGKMPEEVQKTFQSAEEFLQKANRTAEEAETISREVDTLIDESVSPIVEEVNKISEEIRSIFEKGAENGYQDVVDENGNLLRRFELRNGIPKRLIEYGEDGGPVIRETGIKSFKDFDVHDKVNNKEIRIRNGKPESYFEGGEILSDSTAKLAKILSFNNDGRPKSYLEGFEKLSDGSSKIAKALDFENGRPESYFEGVEGLSDRNQKTAKMLSFNNDGRPKSYLEGVENLSDGTSKTAKELDFKNGRPEIYREGWEGLSDGSTRKTAKELSFDVDGRPEIYFEDVEYLLDGPEKIAKELEFENGSPSSYAGGVKIHFKDGDITTTEKSSIKLINGKWVKQN